MSCVCPFWSFYHHQCNGQLFLSLQMQFFCHPNILYIFIFLQYHFPSQWAGLSRLFWKYLFSIFTVAIQIVNPKGPEINTILWFYLIQGHIFRLWVWLWKHLKCSAFMWNFLKLQWKGELCFIEEVSQRCDAAKIPKTAFDGDDPSLILTIWGCVRKNQKCNFFSLSSIQAKIFQ